MSATSATTLSPTSASRKRKKNLISCAWCEEDEVYFITTLGLSMCGWHITIYYLGLHYVGVYP